MIKKIFVHVSLILIFTSNHNSLAQDTAGNKLTSIPKILLSMENANGYSETLIGFPDDATVGIDRSYDAIKFKSQSNFNIFSIINEKAYAIQGLPFFDGVNILLGYDLTTAAEVTFSLELTDMEENLTYYLYDENTAEYQHWDPGNTLLRSPQTGVDQSNLHLIIHRYEIQSTVTWQNEAWSNDVGPMATDNVMIADDYNTATDGSFLAADLLITKGHTLEVTSGTSLDIKGNLYNDGNLEIQSGASLITYDVNWVKGNDISIQRNMRFSTGATSLIGSPMKTSDMITGKSLSSYVYSYDETIPYEAGTEDGLSRWVKVTDASLVPGHGYATSETSLLTFAGTPNNGSILLENLTRTNDATSSPDNHGWHLVSNPYAAAIDVALFIQANEGINSQIAIWDDPNNGAQTRGENADYMIVNELGKAGTGPNGGDFNGSILSSQGFMIQVQEGEAPVDVTFNENMRIANANSDNHFFRQRKITAPKLKIILTGSKQQYSETLIGFPEDASNGFDKRYDAVKLKGKPSYNVYTWIDDKPFAIQGLPMASEMIIPIGLDVPANESFTLSLSTSEMDPSFNYYLYNSTTNLATPWHDQDGISLQKNTELGSKSLQLIISKSKVLHVKNQESNIKFTTEAQSLMLYSNNEVLIDFQIINLSGQEISRGINQKFPPSGLRLVKPSKKGVYILNLTTKSYQQRIKFLVK